MIAALLLYFFWAAGHDAFLRGEQLMRVERYEDAAKEYVNALVADPNHAGARAGWRRARYESATRRARELTAQGRLDEAGRWTEAAREFAPPPSPSPAADWRPWGALAGGGYVVSLICTLYFGLRFAVSNTECR